MKKSGLLACFTSKAQALLRQKKVCLELAVLTAFVLSSAAGVSLAKTSAVCSQVRADTLRLHVVANSDSAEDQALKLQVRDSMLGEVEKLFENAADKSEALQTARQQLPRLQAAAEKAMRENGGGQSVQVRLVRMHFPVTHYQGFSLPAGEYDALRVELGQAAGHNWFCVLYPGLCLPSAEPALYPQPQENELITGPYELRFALLDWLESR